MVLSFTFLELGQSCLSSESAWLTPVVLRTSMMKQVSVTIPNLPQPSGPAACSYWRPSRRVKEQLCGANS